MQGSSRQYQLCDALEWFGLHVRYTGCRRVLHRAASHEARAPSEQDTPDHAGPHADDRSVEIKNQFMQDLFLVTSLSSVVLQDQTDFSFAALALHLGS